MVRPRSRKYLLLALVLFSIIIVLVTNQMISLIRPGGIFRIQNLIRIGFFYDDYDGSVSGDSLYQTLPMEPGALCNIPNLDPFKIRALNLIFADEEGKEKPKCLDKSTLVRFTADNGHLVRVNSSSAYWSGVRCCFTGYRNSSLKNKSSICHSISQSITRIPTEFDFINVKCLRSTSTDVDYEDQFEFFKISQSEQARTLKKLPISHYPAPNILFIGLDSISHTNFIRSFPKSHQYLTAVLDAVEYFGLNKISQGTQGNILATLTGCKLGKSDQNPEPGSTCELVWDAFSKIGYATLRAEDDLGLNNQFFPTLHNGKLDEQNTDYNWLGYLREMKTLNQAKANQFTFGCFDHQWVQNLLMDRILQVARAFNQENRPYFHFTWTATAAHDVIGYAKYLDEPLYKLIRDLNVLNLLNNTILVLVSDHGMAYGTYSRTNEGSIEARMPLLYFVFPPWFREQFYNAVENVKVNALRLSTPFDLHKTLLNLADLESLSSLELLSNQPKNDTLGEFGLSLLHRVPLNRTCESSQIPEEHCICRTKTTLIEPNLNADIVQGVQVGLASLNTALAAFPMCAQLVLDGVEIARRVGSKLYEKSLYEIVFKTQPGGGLFEVTVVVKNAKYKIEGDLVRVNAFGTRGTCLDNNGTEIVPYLVNSACFCGA